MVNGISNVSTLQMIRAMQAFKGAEKTPENIEETNIGVDVVLSKDLQDSIKALKTEPLEEGKLQIPSNDKQINEIKETVEKYGINNLSNEDINYAIRYGRSVLVDMVG